jgi:hypothetical protein
MEDTRFDDPSGRSAEAKTDGRRTPEEDQLLEGLLYELRMAYVARARSQA